MNVPMTQREYERLPDRQVLKGLPHPDQYYRDPAHPTLVFRPNLPNEKVHGQYQWWAFKVDFH